MNPSKHRPTKRPFESSLSSRRLVMPDEINPNGTLFGGVLMSWIDMIAYMCAERHSGTSRIVTASIDRLDFVRPVKIGDHVVLNARIEWTGNTSMSIEVTVEKELRSPSTRESIAVAHLTFVAIDERGRPIRVPSLTCESEEEKERFHDAHIRYSVHRRYRRWKERRKIGTSAPKPQQKKIRFSAQLLLSPAFYRRMAVHFTTSLRRRIPQNPT